jgi:methylated-DNA-[protein]-cysteine S-methyltransferase
MALPCKKLAMTRQTIINTKVGRLCITCHNNKLIQLQYTNAITQIEPPSDSFDIQVSEQLEAYFYNAKFVFELPLELHGTPLQQDIWHHITAIPCGQVLTYGQIAKMLNTSARVVGNACRSNPIPIIIPCHRVVGKNHLGGYCGPSEIGLKRKQWLLEHEQQSI